MPSLCLALLLQLPSAEPAPHSGFRWWEPAIVVAAIGAAGLSDRAVNGWIQDHRSSGGDDLARFFRNGGEPHVVFGISGGILVSGIVTGRPRLRRAGGRVLVSVVVAGLTSTAIKKLAGRLRPAQTNDPLLFKPLSDHESFPSGHATMAFALATSLSEEIHNRWASAALYTFATGTAWSRMNDRRHWLSDALGGAAVGFTAAHIIKRHPPRLLMGSDGARLEWRIAF